MSESRWYGDRVKRRAYADAAQGLADAVQHLLRASNARVPDLSGALQASGTASSDGLRGAASYADEAAVYQHERLDFAHDDGEAKFLERAARAERAEMGRIIARRMTV